MTEKISIPNKSHFTFEEVATVTGVKKYVLRFWETEFDEIDPIISSAGHKLFEHKDIDAILRIKKLLFEDKYTIEKAKSILIKGESLEEEVLGEALAKSHDFQQVDLAQPLANKKLQLDSVPLREELTKIIELAHSLEKRHNWE
ncbi:MAG: MerR family transcriptional regulator [Bacteriovoracaceae bacterium]|nr:MerR family transcriptional regulator [Bacteriovoracaceae bacterium]